MSPARRPSSKKPPRSNPAAHVEFRPRNQVRGSNPKPKGPVLRPTILGEEDGVVVVDKPAGLVTAEKDPNRESALNHVKRWLKAERPGARAWVVHRLDKDASGLLLFATTPAAYTTLKEDLRAHRVQREYVAVVYGVPDWPIGQEITLTDTLLDGAERRMVKVAAPHEASEGRPAVTHVRVLEKGKGRAMLALRLETGRRHQLRVQLSHAGHPILGDRMYGPDERDHGKQKRDQRLCLHAAKLTLHHPTTGQKLELESPPPPRFFTLVGKKVPHGADAEAPEAETHLTSKPAAKVAPKPEFSASSTGWDHVAAWYDKLVGEGQSDHHAAVIVPGALRLLDLQDGNHLLDVACGEGILSRAAAQSGAWVTGVDASGRLIEAAQQRAGGHERYLVGDAQQLEALGLEGPYDAASCIMALMNIDSVEAVFRGVRSLLRDGGRFVAVILHPAFRAPGQTSWQWDEPEPQAERQTGGGHERHRKSTEKQYRRVDGYLTAYAHPIIMNPGAAARGRRPVTTTTHHRPLQSYMAALSRCGFVVDALEEWPSHRTSEPGPRADEENRARREIPMFLALRARSI